MRGYSAPRRHPPPRRWPAYRRSHAGCLLAGIIEDYCSGGNVFGPDAEVFGALAVNGQRALVIHEAGKGWSLMWKGPEEGQRFGLDLNEEATRRVGARGISPRPT